MPKFTDLLDFIQNQMRMSHIYQPVMLMALIKNHGRVSVRKIATQFAQRDEALIEYYSKITKEMPGLFEQLRDLARKRTLNWYY